MKKESIDLVKSVVSMTQEASTLTIDKINEIAPEADETELRMTAKQKASDEGVRYIEPKRRFKGLGTLPEKMKKDHARAWEYVKGIYENMVVTGEPVEFWHNGNFPGDPDCLWNIPCNVPVYVPRFIAHHLEEVQKYHSFSQLAPTSEPGVVSQGGLESMRWFTPSGTHYRGKFRAIGAFS